MTEIYKGDLIRSASYAIYKNLDYEQLYYSDEMYGWEHYTDDVWEYVLECRKIGRKAFRKKYEDYNLYPI